MTPGARTNVALAFALAALIALTWYSAREAPDTDVRLAELDPGSVSTVRIERAGEAAIVVTRDGDAWMMRQPIETAVDPRKVERLIAALNVASQARYRVDGIDAGLVGVGEPPRTRVVIDGEEFAVGDLTALKDHRYVRRGDTVHLVIDFVGARLPADPSSWTMEATD